MNNLVLQKMFANTPPSFDSSTLAMATGVENEIRVISKGLASLDEEEVLCDFSLEDQRAAVEAAGGPPLGPAVRPKLGESLTLVVANVAVGPRGELLMVQEAKRACAGKWYLPAGRAEPGETLARAAAREFKEETGLEGEPRTLLAVESAAGSWFRFVFASTPTGGELKTPAKADAESLQAKWVGDLGEVSLRADDIAPLVERARARVAGADDQWHPDILPAAKPHKRNLLRLVVVIKRRSNNRVHVLLGEKTRLHLPVAEIDQNKSVHSTLRKFLVDVFGADLPQHRPHGLLSVEHCPSETGEPTDGVCLTLLVAFRPPLEEVPIIGKYVWHEVSKELGNELLAKLTSKTATVQFHVVR